MERGRAIPVLVTGTAVPEPGFTKESGAARICKALKRAAAGELFCDHPRADWQFQRNEWVRTSALVTMLNVGRPTIKHAKQEYPFNIEADEGWMRWVNAPAEMAEEDVGTTAAASARWLAWCAWCAWCAR